MFERFTAEARTVVMHAQQHARRLGHRYIGCEHVLLAVAGTAEPAGEVLRGYGMTPDRIEQQIVRLVGLGAGAAWFADLDRAALAAIGIDLDAVRARIEARFGADALTRASQAVSGRRHRFDPVHAVPRRVRRLGRRWARRRRARSALRTPEARAAPAPASGRYRAAGPEPRGHLPFTPGAKRILEKAVHESQSSGDRQIGVQHIALGLLAMDTGLVPPILSALGTSPARVRSAVLDRYRQAS